MGKGPLVCVLFLVSKMPDISFNSCYVSSSHAELGLEYDDENDRDVFLQGSADEAFLRSSRTPK